MHERAGERWGPPQAVSFSREFTDYQPVLSPDGSRLFFTSTRPLPGTTAEVRQNIWFVDRDRDGWQAPRLARGLATSGWDGYAVPTRTGRLYFVSDRSGGLGATDIWMADPVSDGEYAAPVNVAALNSTDSDSDLVVDPEERFIIFHRFVEAANDIDLWIAFRVGDEWSAPRLLDGANGAGWELSPTVSSDGRAFFFARDSEIYTADLCALLRESEQLDVCR
jgi:Tol biopolymer transport system component